MDRCSDGMFCSTAVLVSKLVWINSFIVLTRWQSTILSRDFIITEVKAIGLKSLCSFGHGFFGIRLIGEVFQSERTMCVSMDAWKTAPPPRMGPVERQKEKRKALHSSSPAAFFGFVY
jgi:hypothetical protein